MRQPCCKYLVVGRPFMNLCAAGRILGEKWKISKKNWHVRTLKASHLAKFSSKVPPWLGSVEKHCLLPYIHTTANIQQSSTFSERMLTNAAVKVLGPLCPARLQHFPCSPSFQTLTIYISRLSCLKEYPRRLQAARVRPGQQVSTQRASHIFCSHLTLPSQDSSPSCFRKGKFDLWKTFFADLSTRHLPFMLEFDLWTAYFVEPPCTFFSSGDSSKPSCFLWRFIIVRSLQCISDIVFWERIVFCFVVVSSSSCVCTHYPWMDDRALFLISLEYLLLHVFIW